MEVYKRKDSPYWQITWSDQSGKRHRRSSGTTDKKLADALAAKLFGEAFMETHFGKVPDVLFADAVGNYAKVRKLDNKACFMRSTRYRLKLLLNWFDDYVLSDITPSPIQGFMNERLETVSRGSAQKEVSTLRAVLNKAQRDGLLPTVPNFPRLRKLPGRARWLTLEEEMRLLAFAPSHLLPIIVLAVETGGRLSELLKLNWRDVDLKIRRVSFRNTKNGDDRHIRLSDRAYATLVALEIQPDGTRSSAG